jgi:DNA-binding NtrC family response regulator
MSSEMATILVVDDEPVVTDLISLSLGQRGYDCVIVPNGEDALKKLSHGHIDLVLLDLRLPGVSGMDVLREIRAICPGTAVIVVTATADARSAVAAMKMGATDYITKPFEIDSLNQSVELTLQAATKRQNEIAPQRENSKAKETGWACYLDDIARGVESRLDSMTGHVMTITIAEQTCAIARSLGVPEKQISKWADTRRKRVERIKTLDFLLEKLEQDAVS